MTNSFQSASLAGAPIPVSADRSRAFPGQLTALGLGITAAVAVAVFFTVHWVIAVVGSVAILTLSAVENEAFLLFVIYLIPFGWVLAGDLPIRNLHPVFYSLVIIGFFTGRLLRGQVRIAPLFGPSLSRISFFFLCASVVPTILAKGELTHDSVRSDFELIAFVGFFFLIVAWATSQRRVHQALWALLVSTIITSAFALYQEVSGGFTAFWLYLYPSDPYFGGWEGRAAGFLAQPNALAGYLNLVLPFALACCLLGRGKWKKLAGYTFGLGSLALFSTQSIGGIVAFFSILALAIVCFGRSKRQKVILLATLGSSICLLYLARNVLNPVHTEKYLSDDAISRLLIWGSAWNMFVQSPVIGMGWGNFAGLNAIDMPSTASALASHNLYLQLLAETGVLGFGAFTCLVARSWGQARRQWHSSPGFLKPALAFGVMGALLSVLVHGFVDFLFETNPQYGTLFWMLLALLVASARHNAPSGPRVAVPSA